MKKTLKNRQGFTIVELMIALSILSVILVMASVIMIQIGQLYTKGVAAASLQNAARNISGELSSTLQFSGSEPQPCNVTATSCNSWKTIAPAIENIKLSAAFGISSRSYCVGTTRYTYVLNREMGTDNGAMPGIITPHVLWRDTMLTSTGCPALDLSTTTPSDAATDPNFRGTDLLGNHMSLTTFKIAPVASVPGLYKVDVWLLYGDRDLISTDGSGHRRCDATRSGSQFCSSSEISVNVTRRLNVD